MSVYHPRPAPPRRRPWLIPLLVAVAVVVALAGFALTRQGDDRSASADAPPTGASEPASAEPYADESAADESAPAEPVPGDPASDETAAGGPTSNLRPAVLKNTATRKETKPVEATVTTAPAGPRSVYFRGAKKPSCPSGTDDFPEPGPAGDHRVAGPGRRDRENTAAATETRGNARVGPSTLHHESRHARLHLVAGSVNSETRLRVRRRR